MDYSYEDILNDIDFDGGKFQDINGMMLTNHEIEVLKRYKIPYLKCHNLKELLFEIEDVLGDMDIIEEDLDLISSSISERDYYQNTNK